MNLATLLEGPCNLIHRGTRTHFKGGFTLTPLAELFALDSDQYGPLDRRAAENSVVMTGRPVGVFNAASIAQLHRWQDPRIGQLVTPRYDVASVDATENEITLLGNSTNPLNWPRLGCPLEFAFEAGGTIMAPLAVNTLYYWGIPNPAQPWIGTLHTTEAAAIAGTGAIDLTDDGTGEQYCIEQEPLVIEAISVNRRITFHNGALVTPPPIIGSTVDTLFGPASFGAFIRNNRAWSDANSLYTVEKVALSDNRPDEDDVPTVEMSGAWGAAPLDSFKPRGPVTITPTVSTDAIPTDGRGNVGLKVAALEVSATFQPQGLSHVQMLDLLAMQGGTVRRGGSRARGDLVFSGTGVHLTVYNASARELPQTFQATGPLAGLLGALGTYKVGSGYYRVGTAAP